MDWYAVFVETGREYEVKKSMCKLISSPTVECLVPSRRIAERRQGKFEETVKPLFPGYVLIRATMNMTLYRTLLSAPRVFKVLAHDGDCWSRIPADEMAPLLQLLQHGEIIDYSHVSIQSSEVVVLSGPLYGQEHLIHKINSRKRRIRVSIAFNGVDRIVDLGAILVPSVEEGSANSTLFLDCANARAAGLPDESGE